nr:MAG: putative nucleoprotein [Hebei mivirus 1]
MVKKLGGREAGAITQYKGWITTPRCQATLDDMIKAWVPGGAAGPIVPDEQAVAVLRTKLRDVRVRGHDDPEPLPDYDRLPVDIPAAVVLPPGQEGPGEQQPEEGDQPFEEQRPADQGRGRDEDLD